MTNQVDEGIGKVRMEYFGPRIGAVTFHGKRRIYRFGNNAVDRYQEVDPDDVEIFLRKDYFRVIGNNYQEFQAPGSDFIPEPGGEVVPEVVQEVAPDDEDDYWEAEADAELPDEGVPPALELAVLPNTVKEIKALAGGAGLDTLLSWLKEEQTGKNRKTAIEAIESALESKY